MSRYPDIEEFRDVLPAQLIVPIHSLLAQIQSQTLTLPVPRAEISIRDVELFGEVMLSHEFKAYRNEHAKLTLGLNDWER